MTSIFLVCEYTPYEGHDVKSAWSTRRGAQRECARRQAIDPGGDYDVESFVVDVGTEPGFLGPRKYVEPASPERIAFVESIAHMTRKLYNESLLEDIRTLRDAPLFTAIKRSER